MTESDGGKRWYEITKEKAAAAGERMHEKEQVLHDARAARMQAEREGHPDLEAFKKSEKEAQADHHQARDAYHNAEWNVRHTWWVSSGQAAKGEASEAEVNQTQAVEAKPAAATTAATETPSASTSAPAATEAPAAATEATATATEAPATAAEAPAETTSPPAAMDAAPVDTTT